MTGPATKSTPANTPSPGGAGTRTKPEAFSEPVPLTRPPLLIALTFAVVLLTVGFYAVATAKVTTQVEGTGVMLSGGFTTPVVATQGGQVTSVSVAQGDPITPGQQVAELFVGDALAPVPTPLGGQVLQIETRVGEVVTAGDPLMLVVDPGQPLVVTAPVPADEALRLRTGMDVRVLPVDSKSNDPGYVPGVVAGISALPQDSIGTRQGPSSNPSDATTTDQPTRLVTVSFPNNPTSADQLQWEGTAPTPTPFGQGAVAKIEVITGEQSVLSVLNRSRS